MSLLRQLLVMVGAVAGLTVIGYPLTLRLYGQAGVAPLFWAAGGCGLAGLVSLIPLAITSRLKVHEYLPQAALGGMAIRVLLTGGFLLAVTKATQIPYWPFVIWLMVFYLILLVVETAMSISYAKYFGVNVGGEATS